MTTFGFIRFAVGLFALTFVVLSGIPKAFPVMVAALMKPVTRLPALEWNSERGLGTDDSKTSQSDGNAVRDKLRLELLQASNGYELSPCDDTMRANLVEALTSYTRAWYEMANCRPGVSDCPDNSDDRSNGAAAAFRTPADIRVHDALRMAFRQGGLSREDFPAPLRTYVYVLVQGWFVEPQEVCIAARQARHR
jgi:hypothetical protein